MRAPNHTLHPHRLSDAANAAHLALLASLFQHRRPVASSIHACQTLCLLGDGAVNCQVSLHAVLFNVRKALNTKQLNNNATEACQKRICKLIMCRENPY